MNPKARTRTILYTRVSSAKQADSGLSIEAQETKCRQYAALYDLEIVKVISDAGESAKSLDRPGMQRALAMLREGKATAILVTKMDRLTRSVVDLGTLIADWFASERFNLMCVEESVDTRSASGRLVLNILASVSSWEREAIGERTRSALRQKIGKGERCGAIPLGFRLDESGPRNADTGRLVRLTPDAAEQATIACARALRSEGLSLRAVAAELLVRGHRPRAGATFKAETVKRMCARGEAGS